MTTPRGEETLLGGGAIFSGLSLGDSCIGDGDTTTEWSLTSRFRLMGVVVITNGCLGGDGCMLGDGAVALAKDDAVCSRKRRS